MQLPSFLFKVELPASPAQALFATNWAEDVIRKSYAVPKYSETGQMLNALHYRIAETVRLYQGHRHIDQNALRICIARLVDRMCKQNSGFEINLKLEREDDILFIAPLNLPTLVFIRGLELVPSGLKSILTSWQGEEAEYAFTSSKNYNVKEY